ncbi:hypothetical protein QO179_24760 [Bacillus stercoris]|nr:hypothetical protein [Bacillus stercoris]
MENPRLQAHRSCNFDEFTDIIFHLLNAAWGEEWGTFCEAFPNGREPDNIKMPIITYMLDEMVPGRIGNNNTREIKPRPREVYVKEPGAVGPRAVIMSGRIFDCKVSFDIWEENNSKATELATRFMEFIDMYTGYIKSQGVKEIVFNRYSNNTSSSLGRDNVVCRKVEYDLRLEHLTETPSDVIEKVTGIVSARMNNPDDSIKEDITFKISE